MAGKQGTLSQAAIHTKASVQQKRAIYILLSIKIYDVALAEEFIGGDRTG